MCHERWQSVIFNLISVSLAMASLMSDRAAFLLSPSSDSIADAHEPGSQRRKRPRQPRKTQKRQFPSRPVARREPVEHVLHGDRRVDHYAWLRHKETRSHRYLKAENAYTTRF